MVANTRTAVAVANPTMCCVFQPKFVIGKKISFFVYRLPGFVDVDMNYSEAEEQEHGAKISWCSFSGAFVISLASRTEESWRPRVYSIGSRAP